MILTVHSTSPLEVREPGAARGRPAKVAGGVTYTPVLADRVLVLEFSGRLYILGAA